MKRKVEDFKDLIKITYEYTYDELQEAGVKSPESDSVNNFLLDVRTKLFPELRECENTNIITNYQDKTIIFNYFLMVIDGTPRPYKINEFLEFLKNK